LNKHFLTELEVSNRTHISLATLRRWRLVNRGPLFHKFGSLVRYGEEDLEAWEQTQVAGGEGANRIPPKSAERFRTRAAS